MEYYSTKKQVCPHLIQTKIKAEDWFRIEDKNIQKNMNMFRMAAINLIKQFKARKAISNIMLNSRFFEKCA